MNKIKFLTIGTDKTILESGSVSNTRQVEYYKNFEVADVYVLMSGNPKKFSVGNVNFITLGGANRVVCFVKTFLEIRKKLKTTSYDLIYTQDVLYCGLLGYFVKCISSAKLVTQIHGDYLDNPLWINQRLENRILNMTGKLLVKKSDYVRAVSERIVKYVVENLGKEKGRVRSLPIGIDGDVFNGNNLPETRKKQIVFVGRLMQEKEPHFFCDIVIPVLEQHPDFTCVMIGEGPLKEELQNRFLQAGLADRAFFPGFLKFADISNYYKESFIFLHTAFWEGWGLPMVESTACGLPNVTTDTGCAGEVVIDGVNGIVIKTKNKEDYIQAINSLINNSELHAKLVENCLNSGAEWTFHSMARKIEEFLVYAKNN